MKMPRKRVLLISSAIALWALATLIVSIARMFSSAEPAPWISNLLGVNTAALILTSLLLALYSYKPSILFGIHTAITGFLAFGVYLSVTSGVMAVAHHDSRVMGPRFYTLASVCFIGILIDLCLRIRFKSWFT